MTVIEHDDGACRNCGGPLPKRTFGPRRRFCSKRCDMAWWATARRIGAQKRMAGEVTPDEIERAESSLPSAPAQSMSEPEPKRRRSHRPRRVRQTTSGLLLMSVRVGRRGGRKRLFIEAEFWKALQRIAKARDLPMTALLEEAHAARPLNLAAGLRLIVLTNLQQAAASRVSPISSAAIAPTPSDPARCQCCGELLPSAQARGSERRFCSDQCRNRFSSAKRLYVDQEIKAGRLTPDSVMAACTQLDRVHASVYRPASTEGADQIAPPPAASAARADADPQQGEN